MSKDSRKILITVALVYAGIGVVGLMTGTLSWKGLLFAAGVGGAITFLAVFRPTSFDKIWLQLFVFFGMAGLVVPMLGYLSGVPMMAEAPPENMFVIMLGVPTRTLDQVFVLAVLAAVSFILLRERLKAETKEVQP